ncbi:MAG: GntR family transcriptional regulator [Desulfobacteraceae bacterium]
MPVYVQLANLLSQEIASGELTAGEQLPSEAGICKLYDVSPMTVRRAISLLVDQGVVSTQRGRGTFVRKLDLGAATFKFNDLQELYDNASSIEVKILEVRLDPADAQTAKTLNLPKGEKVIHLKRLLNIDNQPHFYQKEYLICDIHKPVVEAEMEVTSMQSFFEGSGNNLFKWGELNVRAGLMTEEEAKFLEVDMPAAAMHLTHIFYDYSDRPMSWGRFVCRSDLVSFNAMVGINVKK